MIKTRSWVENDGVIHLAAVDAMIAPKQGKRMTRRYGNLMQILIAVLLLVSASLLFAQDRKTLIAAYKGKYVVVLREGLAVGLCSERQVGWTGSVHPLLTVNIDKDTADLRQRGTFLNPLSPSYGCAVVAPEPIHKGEILKVENANIVNVYGRKFLVWVSNVSPHSVQRGTGAYEHQSLEQGSAELVFKLDEQDNAKEPAEAAAVASIWFKVFDTPDAAAIFGNTASGAFVKEIKAGMTVAEVETVLGAPQTKISLNDKTLYKYKDMTVEFRDGVVADVR